MHDDANAQAADAPYATEKGPKVVVAVFAAVVVVGLTRRGCGQLPPHGG